MFFQKRTDAPILRCLRHHPLPVEGGSVSSSCSTSDTKPNPVTLTIYSSPPKAAIPHPSGQRPVKPKPPPAEGRSILRTFLKLTLLSSGAFSATPFLRKGAKYCGGAATFPPSESEHNLSTQPAAVRQLQPAPSGAPLFNLPRSGQHNLRAQRARPLSGCAALPPLSPHQKSPPDNRWAFSYCLILSMILSRKELFPLYWEQSSPISLAKWRRAFFWSSFSRLGTVTWTST